MSEFTLVQLELNAPDATLLTAGSNVLAGTSHINPLLNLTILGASVDNSTTIDQYLRLSFSDGGSIVSNLLIPNVNTPNKPETIIESLTETKPTLEVGKSLIGGLEGFVGGAAYTYEQVISDINLYNQVSSDINLYNELMSTGQVTLGSGGGSGIYLTLGIMYTE